jgi:hypothetical protein
MVVNPNATPVRCTELQLEGFATANVSPCPPDSQIGVATVATNFTFVSPISSAIYNMVPPPGVAAEFAFDATTSAVWVHVMGNVNSAGEFELGSDTRDILARIGSPAMEVQVQLWGNPSDTSHDAMRGTCAYTGPGYNYYCPAPARIDSPLLSMPSSCRSTLRADASVESWEEPGIIHNRSAVLEDSLGTTTATDGCNQLAFDPSIVAQPTTNLSDAPTGLDVNLHFPQTDDFDTLATANFKDVRVALPEGLAVNPSGANGLDACTPAQIGLATAVGETPPHFTEAPAACPEAAKIGSVEVSTPLVDHPFTGSIYAAQPYENPFGSLLAIYIAVADAQTGVVSKLAGKVQTDPATGQITGIFEQNPELPLEDVKTSFFGGPRAALKTPLACATHTISAEIVPWSAPEGATLTRSDSFETSVAAAGSGACPSSEATAPNAPSFTAGTIAPQAGAYSPFVLKLSREDGTQRLTGIDATLPRGLIAKLAGLSSCTEAQIAAAKSREAPRQGVLEQRSPSCPASSEVGTVTVGAGAGIAPYYATGHAYLAGPYKGAPLSLVVISPAVAGPYDLGAVLNRTALHIDPETAQVHAVSDPLPTILQGIPLDIRSIALKMDRPEFTLNPTSCDPLAITGSASLATGQSAALSSPFQVGGCTSLGFKPKLALSLKGATKRATNPRLIADLTYPKGSYANIAKAQVKLPVAAFLDNSHIKTICTRVQFAADTCPAGSIYGKASATTPLVDYTLSGPVYLRSSANPLPDLVVKLKGPDSQPLEVDLVGRTDSVKGALRNTFEAVPDVPASSFHLELFGGKRGLVELSRNLCAHDYRSTIGLTAQNGKLYGTEPKIGTSCKGKGKGRGGGSGNTRRR